MSYKILSLSGGGYLGLYTISVLEKLEEEFGRPLGQVFDLIAGTSIGGIIALGLSSGVPAKDIRKEFEDKGEVIFPNRPLREFVKIAGVPISNLRKSKYSSDALRKVIQKIVGERAKIGDLSTNTIIPAVNLSKGRPQVFKTPHHETFIRDKHLSVIDVALATSAAPTFFPIHRIGGELFADGGLYANSPDRLALHEALHFLEQPIDQVSMLSVGTTTSNFSISNSTNTDMGVGDWMSEQLLIRVLMSAQQASVDDMMKHSLGDRYVRIDCEPSQAQQKGLSLDSASENAKLDLLALAEASARRFLVKPELVAMLDKTEEGE